MTSFWTIENSPRDDSDARVRLSGFPARVGRPLSGRTRGCRKSLYQKFASGPFLKRELDLEEIHSGFAAAAVSRDFSQGEV
jgi:hypothetical protein